MHPEYLVAKPGSVYNAAEYSIHLTLTLTLTLVHVYTYNYSVSLYYVFNINSGKAGTGKTFIVKHIVKLMEKTKAIVVTCTTGMACKLYENAKTLHSFAGLRNGRRDIDALVSSVMNNTGVFGKVAFN
ncbi:hypothetical protein QZH41_005259 [Actinostola sp. cb2023]|nr:hypothetical protein QZH41_005259 [Actinostola sp. cb2023]